jgi:hypothetical protein
VIAAVVVAERFKPKKRRHNAPVAINLKYRLARFEHQTQKSHNTPPVSRHFVSTVKAALLTDHFIITQHATTLTMLAFRTTTPTR